MTSCSHDAIESAEEQELMMGGSISKYLVMDFLAHHQTIWQNSALSLRVE